VHDWYWLWRLIHVYSAIVLVGAITFNTIILMPALKRIPPAQSVVVAQKIGAGLMIMGGTAIVLLGITGFIRAYDLALLGYIFSPDVIRDRHLAWIGLMALCWLFLFVTGNLSAIWYSTILTKKLPYSAGLRDLEERRAAQEKVSAWQDRLAYVNLALAIIAALGGIMASS
jgi:uncharacterized membrane protein